jgi:hypothetical protein
MALTHTNTLRYAYFLSKIIYYLCIILFFIFISLLLAGYFSPKILPPIELKQVFDTGYGIGGFRIHFDSQSIPSDALLLRDINIIMFFWILIRGSFFLIINLIIVRKIIAILGSVQDIKTFYKKNILHFKEIGWWALIGFVASCFNFSYLSDHTSLFFEIAWGPLAVSASCFVLAEIFKEGNELLEDKNSIV